MADPDLRPETPRNRELFTGRTFTIPSERRDRLASVILRYFDRNQALRVLDIGCGTGAQLFELGRVLPLATLRGLDVSEANVRVAEDTRAHSSFRDRVTFVTADYLTFHDDPFDLIVADTVLHAIVASTDELFGKLAADLTPGGLLIYTMPSDCRYNRALAILRRVFRAIGQRRADKLLLVASKLLHGRRYSEAMLRERIPYMYLVPAHYGSGALHRALAESYGLELLEQSDVPHASVAQMKHVMAVLRKRRNG